MNLDCRVEQAIHAARPDMKTVLAWNGGAKWGLGQTQNLPRIRFQELEGA